MPADQCGYATQNRAKDQGVFDDPAGYKEPIGEKCQVGEHALILACGSDISWGCGSAGEAEETRAEGEAEGEAYEDG